MRYSDKALNKYNTNKNDDDNNNNNKIIIYQATGKMRLRKRRMKSRISQRKMRTGRFR
jgi:hypothetical protein